MLDWQFAAALFRTIVIHHGDWIVLAGLAIIFALLLSYQHRGIRVRRSKLDCREVIPEEAWFDTYYPVSVDRRGRVKRVLLALADEIGVEWTQLRPSDSFEDLLRVSGRYAYHDDLEVAGDKIVDLARELGLNPSELPGFRGRLADLLDAITYAGSMKGVKA